MIGDFTLFKAKGIWRAFAVLAWALPGDPAPLVQASAGVAYGVAGSFGDSQTCWDTMQRDWGVWTGSPGQRLHDGWVEYLIAEGVRKSGSLNLKVGSPPLCTRVVVSPL